MIEGDGLILFESDPDGNGPTIRARGGEANLTPPDSAGNLLVGAVEIVGRLLGVGVIGCGGHAQSVAEEEPCPLSM